MPSTFSQGQRVETWGCRVGISSPGVMGTVPTWHPCSGSSAKRVFLWQNVGLEAEGSQWYPEHWLSLNLGEKEQGLHRARATWASGHIEESSPLASPRAPLTLMYSCRH